MENLAAAISKAITAAINDFGATSNLPPLEWEVSHESDTALEGTHPGGRDHPDSADLCERWANFLRITELSAFEGDGCRSWIGHIDNWQVGFLRSRMSTSTELRTRRTAHRAGLNRLACLAGENPFRWPNTGCGRIMLDCGCLITTAVIGPLDNDGRCRVDQNSLRISEARCALGTPPSLLRP